MFLCILLLHRVFVVYIIPTFAMHSTPSLAEKGRTQVRQYLAGDADRACIGQCFPKVRIIFPSAGRLQLSPCCIKCDNSAIFSPEFLKKIIIILERKLLLQNHHTYF